MYLPDFHFHIANYTDTKEDGSIQKSASLELRSETTYQVNMIVKILVDGHINAPEIMDPNKKRKREQIRKKILSELRKGDIDWLDSSSYDYELEDIAYKMVEALTSWRWLNEPFWKYTQQSPSWLHRVEKYKLWFDGTPLED